MATIEARVLSVPQLQNMLGVSRPFIYGRFHAGDLTMIKLGNKTVVMRDEVEAYLTKAARPVAKLVVEPVSEGWGQPVNGRW